LDRSGADGGGHVVNAFSTRSLEYVRNAKEIGRDGVMVSPVFIVNENLKSAGSVPLRKIN